MATPMPTLPTLRAPGKGASRGRPQRVHRQRFNEQLTELSDWWLRRMVAVQQPIHEKLTLLWHNHFATSAEKVWFAAYMAAQNHKLRSSVARRFPHARLLDVDRRRDDVLAGCSDQHRQGTQRKPGARVHGAVRARARQRLHRGRCARGCTGIDRVGHPAAAARPR